MALATEAETADGDPVELPWNLAAVASLKVEVEVAVAANGALAAMEAIGEWLPLEVMVLVAAVE